MNRGLTAIAFLPGAVAALTANTAKGESSPNDESTKRLDPSERGGLEWALRGGGALPFGHLRDGVDAVIPVRLQLGRRMDGRSLFVGGYGQLGALVCSFGTSCWGIDLRAGAEIAGHPLAGTNVDPWFAMGLGLEVAQTKTTMTLVPDFEGALVPARVGVAVAGLDWNLFTFGVNFRVARRALFGPFMSIDLASLANTSSERIAPSGVRSGPTGATVWVSAGMNLSFVP